MYAHGKRVIVRLFVIWWCDCRVSDEEVDGGGWCRSFASHGDTSQSYVSVRSCALDEVGQHFPLIVLRRPGTQHEVGKDRHEVGWIHRSRFVPSEPNTALYLFTISNPCFKCHLDDPFLVNGSLPIKVVSYGRKCLPTSVAKMAADWTDFNYKDFWDVSEKVWLKSEWKCNEQN